MNEMFQFVAITYIFTFMFAIGSVTVDPPFRPFCRWVVPDLLTQLIPAESLNDFVAGYVSGIAGLVIGSPLDILKVRLQASSSATVRPIDNFPKVPNLPTSANDRQPLYSRAFYLHYSV